MRPRQAAPLPGAAVRLAGQPRISRHDDGLAGRGRARRRPLPARLPRHDLQRQPRDCGAVTPHLLGRVPCRLLLRQGHRHALRLHRRQLLPGGCRGAGRLPCGVLNVTHRLHVRRRLPLQGGILQQCDGRRPVAMPLQSHWHRPHHERPDPGNPHSQPWPLAPVTALHRRAVAQTRARIAARRAPACTAPLLVT